MMVSLVLLVLFVKLYLHDVHLSSRLHQKNIFFFFFNQKNFSSSSVPRISDSMRAAGVKGSEICEEDDESCGCERIDAEAQKDRIRKIVSHQKSLYLSSHLLSSLTSSSSASDSSSSTSSCSFSSSSRSSSLLELMKGGGTSLGRLLDMEQISLAAHLKDYSGSPVTRPMFLWGSDSCEEEALAYWSSVKSLGRCSGKELGGSNSNRDGELMSADGDGIVAKEAREKN